jgi:hypothetical protein
MFQLLHYIVILTHIPGEKQVLLLVLIKYPNSLNMALPVQWSKIKKYLPSGVRGDGLRTAQNEAERYHLFV